MAIEVAARKSLAVSLAAGFTLIEMMIVLTIIAILSTLAMPSFKGVATSTRLKSSAKGIRDLCHFARNMAITEQLGYFVILDMDQNQYWLADIETFNTAFAAADNMLMQPETSTTAQQLNPMNQTVTTQQLTANGICSWSSQESYQFSPSKYFRSKEAI